MNLGLRLFLVLAAIGTVAVLVSERIFEKEIGPTARQVVEETLIDFASVLAEVVAVDVQQTQTSTLNDALKRASERQLRAHVYEVIKERVELIVYVTDTAGKVLFHTDHAEVGKDYSSWNDVRLTLTGAYGARATRMKFDQPQSSVMFVAAPIRSEDKLIGVVSVGKPSNRLMLYVEDARQRMQVFWGLLLAALVLAAVAISALESKQLEKLRQHVEALGALGTHARPILLGSQLNQLAKAVEDLRQKLDDKAYVEQLTQSLAHALRSPLSGIRAAAEVVEESSDGTAREFAKQIQANAERLENTVQRMLRMVRYENSSHTLSYASVHVKQLLRDVVKGFEAAALDKNCKLHLPLELPEATIVVDVLLMKEAMSALVENALSFATPATPIEVHVGLRGEKWCFQVKNVGPLVPEFALPRVFERFYSLSRDENTAASTGLGLSFVAMVAALHGGAASIENWSLGVIAQFEFVSSDSIRSG